MLNRAVSFEISFSNPNICLYPVNPFLSGDK